MRLKPKPSCTAREMTIRRPDDWHMHARKGERMRSVIPMTARQFGRAILMPNVSPYITTIDRLQQYRDEVLAAIPSDSHFEPHFALYLQTSTSPATIRAAAKLPYVRGMKLYPLGKTTGSDGGVLNIWDVDEQLGVMEEVDLPLLIHGEATHPSIDTFRREPVFYVEQWEWLWHNHRKLRATAEHITTTTAVEAVERLPKWARVGATITTQHLLGNRNNLLDEKLEPDWYCKPILQSADNQASLIKAATSGNPRFFGGTDSAPHARHEKYATCGCAGCFTAHAALELYAEAFENAEALERLEDFLSRFGADFYELPYNEGTVTLRKEAWLPPKTYKFGGSRVVPFRRNKELQWKLAA